MAPHTWPRARADPGLLRQLIEYPSCARLAPSGESPPRLAAVVPAPEPLHSLMEGPPPLDGQGVGEAGLPLQLRDSRDVDVMVWLEVLRLGAQLDLVEVEGESPAAAQPGIVGEQRRSPVVAMRVDRPVREDD